MWEYLKAIDREKTAKDAFFETSSKHYDIILFIHDWIWKSRSMYQMDGSNDRISVKLHRFDLGFL